MQNELITIAKINDLPSAGLAKSMLGAEGIFSFIPNETIIGLKRPYMGAYNGIELRVSEGVAGKAIGILKRQNETNFKQESSSILGESEVCPKCGSTEIYNYNPIQNARIISPLTFLIYLFSSKRIICNNCGEKFKKTASNPLLSHSIK